MTPCAVCQTPLPVYRCADRLAAVHKAPQEKAPQGRDRMPFVKHAYAYAETAQSQVALVALAVQL